MGCEFNFGDLSATNDKDAVKDALSLIERAAYEHGHGGYTGSFAEAFGVLLVKHVRPDDSASAEWATYSSAGRISSRFLCGAAKKAGNT